MFTFVCCSLAEEHPVGGQESLHEGWRYIEHHHLEERKQKRRRENQTMETHPQTDFTKPKTIKSEIAEFVLSYRVC